MTQAKQHERRAKAAIIAISIALLLPLAVLAIYRMSYFYPITGMSASVLEEADRLTEELLEKEAVIYLGDAAQPMIENKISKNISVKEFDILSKQVTFNIAHENANGNLTFILVESDGDKWVCPTISLEPNWEPQKELNYNVANYTYLTDNWKKQGLKNITNIIFEIEVDAQGTQDDKKTAKIIVNQISTSDYFLDTKYLVIQPFNVTADRYRNQYPIEKSKNALRIIALGDSMLYGASISNESHTFIMQLENKLNADLESDEKYKIEILNFGIGGYDAESEVDLYQNELHKYGADAVMIFLGRNDLNSNREIQKYADKLMNETRYKAWYATADEGQKFFVQKNLVYDAAMQYFLEHPQKTQEDFNKITLQLHRLRELLNGTPLIIITMYDTDDALLKTIEQFSEENQVPHLGLNQILTTYGPKRIYLRPDSEPVDSHPSLFAHQIIAEELYDFLTENKLIPKLKAIEQSKERSARGMT